MPIHDIYAFKSASPIQKFDPSMILVFKDYYCNNPASANELNDNLLVIKPLVEDTLRFYLRLFLSKKYDYILDYFNIIFSSFLMY